MVKLLQSFSIIKHQCEKSKDKETQCHEQMNNLVILINRKKNQKKLQAQDNFIPCVCIMPNHSHFIQFAKLEI